MSEVDLSYYEAPEEYDGKHTDRRYNWFITINNWTDVELEIAEQFPSSYKLIAKEHAPSTGTPHIHVYLELENGKSFARMKKIFPRANIKVALGNAEQNKTYLSKECLYFEEGIPKKQGQRSDIDIVREQLAEGANIRSVIQTARSHQSIKIADIWFKYFEKPRNWKTKVTWIYGSSGVGKTRLATERCEGHDIYMCMENTKWFEGYDGHSHVIVDDIREGDYKFQTLIKMIDRYEFRVECKNGSRQFLAKEIYITAPKHPKVMFEFSGEDTYQLIRRIDEIIFLEDNIEEDGENEKGF